MPNQDDDTEEIAALECFSFTVNENEAAGIHAFLADNGCEANSQGLKKFLLVHAGLQKENGEVLGEEGLSSGVARLTAALQRHPEVTVAMKKEGARIVGSLVRRFLTS